MKRVSYDEFMFSICIPKFLRIELIPKSYFSLKNILKNVYKNIKKIKLTINKHFTKNTYKST